MDNIRLFFVGWNYVNPRKSIWVRYVRIKDKEPLPLLCQLSRSRFMNEQFLLNNKYLVHPTCNQASAAAACRSMPQHTAACRSMPQHLFFGAAHGGFEACRSMLQRAKIFTWRTFFS